jgi:hypothetical protein
MGPLPVVVAGHICVDVIPKLDHLPSGQFMQLFQPGRLIVSGPATFSTGGPVSNTGLSLHRLGVPTRLIARVGNDPFAQIVRTIVDAYSPDLSEGIVSSESATSYSIIINPPGIDRIFLHHPGSNDAFRASDVNYELVSNAALFHFGYPPMMQQMYADNGAELVEMLRRSKQPARPPPSIWSFQTLPRRAGRPTGAPSCAPPCPMWISLSPVSRKCSSCCGGRLTSRCTPPPRVGISWPWLHPSSCLILLLN